MLVGRLSPLDGEKMNLNPSKEEIDYIREPLKTSVFRGNSENAMF
jgi:hypothetical protein